MTVKDDLEKLIVYGYENDSLDFKSVQYETGNRESLIKDVMAMANSFSERPKYIIFGVKKHSHGEYEIRGIEKEKFRDSAEYQQLIYANIEPDLNIEYFPFEYNGSLLGILKIPTSQNRPYILKKKIGNLNAGLCYVRKGSQQLPATRSDLDQFYFLKQEIGVEFKTDYLFAYGHEGLSKCSLLFKNYSNNPTTIMGALLTLCSQTGEEISRHRMYGMDKKHVGSDFSFELKNKSEVLTDGIFGFISSDCLRLNMSSDGLVSGLVANLEVWDSSDRIYKATMNNFGVMAKGKSLWKVEEKERKEKQKL